jgi:hypothetical protein
MKSTILRARNQTVHTCNRHILEALELARQLTILADEGELNAEDDSCVLLYSIVRDCAYKIRRQAEQERQTHIALDVWDEPFSSKKQTSPVEQRQSDHAQPIA